MRKVVLESGADSIDHSRHSLQALLDGRYRPGQDQISRAPAASTRKLELNREGWVHWPEREDLSLEFMRLLAAAQDGGSTVSEC